MYGVIYLLDYLLYELAYFVYELTARSPRIGKGRAEVVTTTT